MKQSGKTWLNPEGRPTDSKYVPEFEKASERIANKLGDLALEMEEDLSKTKVIFHKLCQEMYARVKAKLENDTIKNISFTNFDRSIRVEASFLEGDKAYYRVYAATKPNPTTKDYRLINTDFIKAVGMPVPAQADFSAEETVIPEPNSGSTTINQPQLNLQ